MAAGDATAGDVPGRYDVVINGKGYVFADSLESSIPFRTHRAIYDISPTFVQRQNVSNQYGDNAQDYFLTARQRDWSLGEQQKFFRTGQDGRYWMGQNIDNTIAGQVRLSPQFGSLTFAAPAKTGAREVGSQHVNIATTTNLYRVSGQDASITDLGAHGLGAAPSKFGCCTDGVGGTYLSTTSAGSVGIRKWNLTAFSTFSAATVDSLAFVNNTLFGVGGGTLISLSATGVASTLFTWKGADGSAFSSTALTPVMAPYGGQLLLLFPYAQEASELWIYDGAGVKRLEVLPENFIASDIDVLYGVAYIAGSFMKSAGSTTDKLQPAILFWDGSQIGLLWKANDFNTSTIAVANQIAGPHPALGVSNGRLIFTDETTGNFMAYDPARGGVSSVGAFTPNSGDNCRIVSTGLIQVHIRDQTGGYYSPSTTYPSSGYVISSLMDFDSSLTKQFRGVTVEFEAASDGDGGSVDIAYQTDSVAGSWTTLRTGAVSGTEYTFSNVSGHAIAIKVTINKGTSTAGPVLKSLNVRAAPQLRQFQSGTYIIDCTGDPEYPRELRDGSYHPLDAYSQVQNLLTAARATAPFIVTDRLRTFTGLVDINDPEGFDIYEVHPDPDNPSKSGSYFVRIKLREV